jgi:hypothetical protein
MLRMIFEADSVIALWRFIERRASLLAEDRDEIADVDILEKHLPVFKEMKTPFVIPRGARSRLVSSHPQV